MYHGDDICTCRTLFLNSVELNDETLVTVSLDGPHSGPLLQPRVGSSEDSLLRPEYRSVGVDMTAIVFDIAITLIVYSFLICCNNPDCSSLP